MMVTVEHTDNFSKRSFPVTFLYVASTVYCLWSSDSASSPVFQRKMIICVNPNLLMDYSSVFRGTLCRQAVLLLKCGDQIFKPAFRLTM